MLCGAIGALGSENITAGFELPIRKKWVKRRFDLRFNSRKFADKNVEHRREKDAEKRHSHHPREDGCPERLTHLGAGSAAEHEWDDASDECEGGHQDGAQT